MKKTRGNFAVMARLVGLVRPLLGVMAGAVAMGVAGVFGAQTILNIGMCLYVAPVVGVTLPFFSYGGTALFVLLCEIGVLLSISRRANLN